MKFLELELTNWGPHLHKTITFDPNAKVIAIAGENDKGKSWVLRALAGAFVTGKNEYFDKSAIFDGEDSSEIKLKFLGNTGNTHEVRKVITRQGTEGEDEIHLDGEKISPTKYVEFLCEEFQVTDPKILLSLAISMQGETHFYLKAKKREREEGLRSLRQLDRIDSWKEHLTRLISTQDKSLTEKKNTLLGRKTSLEEQKTQTQARIETLKEELTTLLKGQTPEGKPWVLSEQIEIWEKWSAIQSELETLKRELQTLRSNITLYKQSLGRHEEEKAKSPIALLTSEQIQEKEEELTGEEKHHREALNWKRVSTEEKALQTLTESITTLEKEVEEIKVLLTKEQEETLHQAKDEYDFAKKDISRMENGPETPIKIDELKEKVKELQDQETTQREKQDQVNAKVTTANRVRRLLESNLREVGITPQTKNPQDWAELILKETDKLRKELTSKKISLNEANLLQQRILANWPEKGPVPCPITEEDLAQNKRFSTSEARKALQTSLENKLAESEDESQQELPGGAELQKLIHLETLLKKDIPFFQEEEETAQATIEALKGQPTADTLKSQREKLEDTLKNWEVRTTAEKELKTKEENLLEACLKHNQGTVTETATWLLRENQVRQENKTSKLRQIKEKSEQEKEVKTRIDKAKASCEEKTPQVRILLLQEETDLQEQYKKISQELEAFRKSKTDLAPTLVKILQEKTRIEESETIQKTKVNRVTTLEAQSAWDIGLIHPQDETNPEEAGAHWNKTAKRKEDIETLLKEEIPKTEEISKKITETIKGIEEVSKEASDIEAGQEVTNFLDYKNAPRKLLAMTVDQIFYQANKISKIFQMGMALSQGKNLEFNVIQTRKGREITQKTERLGFGKANILGICTRLAAQKILAPQTGFLILDEPSAYVDAFRKNAFREFIQKLGENQDLDIPQIILVEHEESIAQAANQIIWIE